MKPPTYLFRDEEPLDLLLEDEPPEDREGDEARGALLLDDEDRDGEDTLGALRDDDDLEGDVLDEP